MQLLISQRVKSEKNTRIMLRVLSHWFYLVFVGKMTDANMTAYILRRVRQSTIFLGKYEKLTRRYVAHALKVFASSDDESRVQAILFIRSIAMKLPPPALDNCLKGIYKTFVSHAKFVSPSSASNLRFMASCAVEMYGIDFNATYQHAFTAIKDLAIITRQALTSKSKESYREVYCWQTINCFELWAAVLTAYPKELHQLYYPLIQLLLGACGLINSPSYIPLRLKCVRMLNKLGRQGHVYVPVSPVLLEILKWKDLYRKAKPAQASTSPDINLRLRVGSSVLQSSSFQQEVVDNVFELLTDHLALWSYHPAFFELAVIPLLRLKGFSKKTGVDRFRRSARQICQSIIESQNIIAKERSKAHFSPKDATKIAAFVTGLTQKEKSSLDALSEKLQEHAEQRQRMRSMDQAIIDDDQDGFEISRKKRKQGVSVGSEDVRKRSKANNGSQTEIEPMHSSDSDDGSASEDEEDRVDVYELSDDNE